MTVRPHIVGRLLGPGLCLFGLWQLPRSIAHQEVTGTVVFGTLAVICVLGGWIAARVTWIELSEGGIRLQFPLRIVPWTDVTRVSGDSEVIVFHTKSDSFVLARRAFRGDSLRVMLESKLANASRLEESK